LSLGSETYFVKSTGGKAPICRDLIERGGTSELGVGLCRVTTRAPPYCIEYNANMKAECEEISIINSVMPSTKA
jgi:hypothetical protein